MPENKHIFTLKQVVSSIRKTIEERYQQLYWVKAEMHKLNQYPSGHCFPELVQKEKGKIVAEMRGTIWKHQFEQINHRFITIVKEPLKEDSTLLMQVKINFHETFGLSLQIVDIDPNYSLGELQKEKQETLKKLHAKGILNQNQELPFPLLPQRIAVISAESSKGLSDFMEVLHKNNFGYAFFTMLFPAYLQGDHASRTIIEQLQLIKKVRRHFDAVVIVRGGGGEVGLSCYNEYHLCEAISTYPLPILTGIGHSTNMTVAEMVSYRNAITPTELADFFIQAFHQFSVPVKDAQKNIHVSAKRTIEKWRQSLQHVTMTFNFQSKRSLTFTRQKLIDQARKLDTTANHLVQLQRHRLDRLEHSTSMTGKQALERHQQQLNQLEVRLPKSARLFARNAHNQLAQLEHSIRIMDPIHVLKRGYSITRFQKKTIGPQNEVNPGDEIRTHTAEWIITSTITQKKDNHE